MDAGAIAVSIPLVVVFFVGLTWFSRTPIGKAIAERIAGGGGGGGDERVLHRLDEMQEELTGLRHELVEAHERLDFAERLLAERGSAERAPLDKGR